MVTVTFHDKEEIDDARLKFAVIAARYEGKWVFCRHKKRATWEIPGGHREEGEAILDTARRELWEETGAEKFDLSPICIYGVSDGTETTYGLLCFAEINKQGELSDEVEIQETKTFAAIPKELTYPAIQPHLFNHVQGWLNSMSRS